MFKLNHNKVNLLYYELKKAEIYGANKSRYVGDVINNVKEGFGLFYFGTGGYYQGKWKNNKMEGLGTLYYWENRAAYEGEWKEDMFDGFGTLYNENPSKIA
jgi:hypothetical protein